MSDRHTLTIAHQVRQSQAVKRLTAQCSQLRASLEKQCPPIIDVVRAAARAVGWGIGSHGSLVRDIDLIAIPWVESAVSITEVFEVIKSATGYTTLGHIPRLRPGGRFSVLLMHPDATFEKTEKGTWTPPCLDISFADPRHGGP